MKRITLLALLLFAAVPAQAATWAIYHFPAASTTWSYSWTDTGQFGVGLGFYYLPITTSYNPGQTVDHCRIYMRGRHYPNRDLLNRYNTGNNVNSSVGWGWPGLPRTRFVGDFGMGGDWSEGLTAKYTSPDGNGTPWTWARINGSELGAMTASYGFTAHIVSSNWFYAIDVSDFDFEVWCKNVNCPGGYAECEDYDDSSGDPCPGCGQLSRIGEPAPVAHGSTWGALKQLYRP